MSEDGREAALIMISTGLPLSFSFSANEMGDNRHCMLEVFSIGCPALSLVLLNYDL